MSLFEDDGYKYFKIGTYGDFLVVESEILEKCVNVINKNNLKNICIGAHWGYKLSDINFINNCLGIEKIYLVGDNFDLTPINKLHRLKFISTSSKIERLDFGSFKKLEYCSISWSVRIINITQCEKLSHLALYNNKSNLEDLSLLPYLKNLKCLELFDFPILKLLGVEKYKNSLVRLEIHFCKKIIEINQIIELTHLNTLYISNSKKIKNIDITLGIINSLNILKLTDCGEIPSIKFIKNMAGLRFFSFVNTTVLDGDMTPCLKLEYAGFIKKKHYSHSSDEIREAIVKFES